MKVSVNGEEMTQSAFVTGMFLKPKNRVKPKPRQKAGRRQGRGERD